MLWLPWKLVMCPYSARKPGGHVQGWSRWSNVDCYLKLVLLDKWDKLDLEDLNSGPRCAELNPNMHKKLLKFVIHVYSNRFLQHNCFSIHLLTPRSLVNIDYLSGKYLYIRLLTVFIWAILFCLSMVLYYCLCGNIVVMLF